MNPAGVAPAKTVRWWRAERAMLSTSRRVVRRSRATDHLPQSDRPYDLVREACDLAAQLYEITKAERPDFRSLVEPYISDHDWQRAGYGARVGR